MVEVEDRVEQRNVHALGHVGLEGGVQPAEDGRRIGFARGEQPERGAAGRHHQGGGGALAGNVGDGEAPLPRPDGDDVVVVAAE